MPADENYLSSIKPHSDSTEYHCIYHPLHYFMLDHNHNNLSMSMKLWLSHVL